MNKPRKNAECLKTESCLTGTFSFTENAKSLFTKLHAANCQLEREINCVDTNERKKRKIESFCC